MAHMTKKQTTGQIVGAFAVIGLGTAVGVSLFVLGAGLLTPAA
jgi:hypothetical protein